MFLLVYDISLSFWQNLHNYVFVEARISFHTGKITSITLRKLDSNEKMKALTLFDMGFF